jgi:DNA polymerase-1
MYDENEVRKKYGVASTQLSDVFALMGDVVDNVPGIKGIGEKTAVKLIKEFQTLENILQNIDSLKGNIGKLIHQNEHDVLLSKKLIELNKQIPIDYKLKKFENKALDESRIATFFEKYEFKSLQNKRFTKFEDISQLEIVKKEQKKIKLKTEIVNTCKRANEIAKIIKQVNIFALKTVFSITNSLEVHVIGVSICIEGKPFYFPIGHNDLTIQQITFYEFKNIFASLFSSNKIKKIGYDLKQERNIYERLGIKFTHMYFDVMLASYCLDPAKSHNIIDISKEYLNFIAGDDSYLGKGSKKITLAESIIEDSAKYANSISTAAFAMYKIFGFQIKERKLLSFFFNVEMPLIEVLSEIEISGIKIDLSFLCNFDKKITNELKKVENTIYKIADEKFNINSPKQLSSIMFEKLNLPIIKKTKTGYSTDEDVLTELSFHEFPSEVLKYRELQKLKSTYVEPIMNYCTQHTKIHSIFNQAVTTTGRLSSTEPNLQNIPIKSTYGKEFRKVFIPNDNKIFISADYSQIDLRVLAHISKDKKLIEAFKNNMDIHSMTAREIFNIPKNTPVPDNLRNASKSINFGIVYGMSSFGLSKQLNISFGKARKYIDEYFSKYNGVKLWMKQIIEQASKSGYVYTITGRMRYIPELHSTNSQVRNYGERMSLNTPIQGSSADIIKIAMVNIYNEFKLKNYKSLMLLQIHDDLLFEVPYEEIENIISVIKDKMENAVVLNVPLSVDIKTGSSWGEMKKYDNRTYW